MFNYIGRYKYMRLLGKCRIKTNISNVNSYLYNERYNH